jgi:TetR/AcrR family transcriptional regulator, cholesterol catabolism regulator
MNDRLYPAGTAGVNDRDRIVNVFLTGFAGQPDLAGLTPAARKVLATAAAMFFERGAVDASVRDLTRACGLSPGALYNHFASKDELLDTIVRHGHLRMRRRVERALESCPDRPVGRLDAFVHAYVAGHLASPELAQVVRREYLHLSPERYRAVVAERRRFRRVLETILSDGLRAGSFDIIGADTAMSAPAVTGQAVMILDMCSRTSEWFVRGGSTDADELARRYVLAARRMVAARA